MKILLNPTARSVQFLKSWLTSKNNKIEKRFYFTLSDSPNADATSCDAAFLLDLLLVNRGELEMKILFQSKNLVDIIIGDVTIGKAMTEKTNSSFGINRLPIVLALHNFFTLEDPTTLAFKTSLVSNARIIN